MMNNQERDDFTYSIFIRGNEVKAKQFTIRFRSENKAMLLEWMANDIICANDIKKLRNGDAGIVFDFSDDKIDNISALGKTLESCSECDRENILSFLKEINPSFDVGPKEECKSTITDVTSNRVCPTNTTKALKHI